MSKVLGIEWRLQTCHCSHISYVEREVAGTGGVAGESVKIFHSCENLIKESGFSNKL